jgi:hypothetical protein
MEAYRSRYTNTNLANEAHVTSYMYVVGRRYYRSLVAIHP